MLLAIDVGNTNMGFTLFQGEKSVVSFRIVTDVKRTSDEIAMAIYEHLRRIGVSIEGVCDLIVASVVPPAMCSLSGAISRYFGREPIVVGVDVDPGLSYDVACGERLGADRAVACVAAIEKYGAPLVVLDFGTATTVDVIDHRGRYLGGCIAAGIRTAADALSADAALLPHIELRRPDRVIGTSTEMQSQVGAVSWHIGAVEYLVRETKREMGGGEIRVVATGGLANVVAECEGVIDILDPSLIPDGLRMIYDRNYGRNTPRLNTCNSNI